MDIFLEKEFDQVKEVNNDKGYWFIRTYSGEAFNEYLDKGYVGLGLNSVPFSMIAETKPGDLVANKSLQSFIEDHTPYKKGSATNWANQLVAFNHEVKVGDTVIIPSRGSESLAIGTVTSNIYVESKPQNIEVRGKVQPLPERRRRIKWEKRIDKYELQGDLRNLLASHQGITNANTYSEIIEGTLSSLFSKGQHTYLVIQIKQDEEINAFELNRFLNGLTFFYKEFCKEYGIDDNEDLTIKIKLQSRGKTVLKAAAIIGILGLAALVALSNNAEVQMDVSKMKMSGKSDGFLKSISDFLDANQRRKMQWESFQDSMQQLKAAREKDSVLEKPIAKTEEHGREE